MRVSRGVPSIRHTGPSAAATNTHGAHGRHAYELDPAWVEGEIPRELMGTYFRNGPGLQVFVHASAQPRRQPPCSMLRTCPPSPMSPCLEPNRHAATEITCPRCRAPSTAATHSTATAWCAALHSGTDVPTFATALCGQKALSPSRWELKGVQHEGQGSGGRRGAGVCLSYGSRWGQWGHWGQAATALATGLPPHTLPPHSAMPPLPTQCTPGGGQAPVPQRIHAWRRCWRRPVQPL